MSKKPATRCIGILTSGGDCPGLNAAIRGVAKTVIGEYGMKVIGIVDGFRGLVENRTMPLDSWAVSGILTSGGTILGTSRDKPHKMQMGHKVMDMTETAVENARKLGIDCLVCLGGGGTQKNASRLMKAGLNVLTLPKTIDNDVARTDITFGFDTALGIATEAVDRLHTTASSHHRVIVCEIMGHAAGWLTLGAGIAGGADVILIPEIPFDVKAVANHLIARRQAGKRFSIVAIAEGAMTPDEARALARAAEAKEKAKKDKKHKKEKKEKKGQAEEKEAKRVEKPVDMDGDGKPDATYTLVQESRASRFARVIQQLTDTEVRVTELGHVQRGGSPSPADRLLCTRLGAKAGELLAEGVYNVMVAARGDDCVPVDLDKVAGQVKLVPPDHPWIKAARLIGTCMGDE